MQSGSLPTTGCRPWIAWAAVGCLAGLTAMLFAQPETPQVRFLAVFLGVGAPLLVYYGLSRKWFQFSLRTAFILMVLAAIGMKQTEGYRVGRHLAAAVAELDGVTHTKPILPDWMPEKIGGVVLAEHCYYVHRIWLKNPTDHDLYVLAKLPGADRVECLGVYGPFLTEIGIDHIRKFPSLAEVGIIGSGRVDDAAIQQILQMPRIRTLTLDDRQTAFGRGVTIHRTPESRFVRVTVSVPE